MILPDKVLLYLDVPGFHELIAYIFWKLIYLKRVPLLSLVLISL